MQPFFIPAPPADFPGSQRMHIPDDAVEIGLSGGVLFSEGGDAVVSIFAAVEGGGI